jgi:hypothetical protein
LQAKSTFSFAGKLRSNIIPSPALSLSKGIANAYQQRKRTQDAWVVHRAKPAKNATPWPEELKVWPLPGCWRPERTGRVRNSASTPLSGRLSAYVKISGGEHFAAAGAQGVVKVPQHRRTGAARVRTQRRHWCLGWMGHQAWERV